MLSATSFTDELARYKTGISKHATIVRRWQAFAADKMWRGIQDAASRHRRPPLDANKFIDEVLSATWSVTNISEHDKQVKSEWERLKRKMILAVRDADSPMELSRLFSTTFEPHLLTLHRSSYDFNSPPVSRKNQGGSRDRIAFISRVSRYLEIHCGQPRDEAVALLTDIAFPGTQTSVDQVRLARRPSTQAGRKIKPLAK